MNYSDPQQNWIKILKEEFEKQKLSWAKAPAKPHQQVIRQLQQEHFSCFLKTGFPSIKDSDWKFTNTHSFLKTTFPPVVSLPSLSVETDYSNTDFFPFTRSHTIHFHNGNLTEHSMKHLSGNLQLYSWKDLNPDCPAWPWITQALKRKGDAFHHLAGAFPLNGYILFVPHHTSSQSIPIRYENSGAYKREKPEKPKLDQYRLQDTITPSFDKVKDPLPDPKNTIPLHIHFSFDEPTGLNDSAYSLWNFRNFIFLDEGAAITLIESVSTRHINTQGRSHKMDTFPVHFTEQKASTQQNTVINMSTDVKLSPQSSLKWLNMDQEPSPSVHLNQVYCDMEEQSNMDRLSFFSSSGLSRDTVEVHHSGEKARSVLSGLAILKQQAWKDQRFYINHLKKQGYSRQFSRGILNDRAKNIFQGKTYVSPEAIQTDCAQSAKNLLLSSTADAYTQPELEIKCGEVKAQHGATTGQLNQDEIFYLQSRGLNQTKAFKLLIMGFIKHILNRFPEKNLVEILTKKIEKINIT